MTKEEALQEAIRILTREADMLERHASRPRYDMGELEVREQRYVHMMTHAKHLKDVTSALQGAGGIGGATFHLNGEESRMLMNYLDRAHVIDEPVLRASVVFDGDKKGSLEALLKAVVAECRTAYLRSVLPESMAALKGLADE